MRFLLLILGVCMFPIPLFAIKDTCQLPMPGYRVVKNSLYSFIVNKKRACFFAFYTPNLEPGTDPHGDGNSGDAIWYAYYIVDNPNQIYELPKPSDDLWGKVCSLEAISFYPMYENKKRDITIIGSCNKQNAIHYTYPFVFSLKNNKYVLDTNVYLSLYGFIGLTVGDVRAYIKSPDTCYRILENRFNWHGKGKESCD